MLIGQAYVFYFIVSIEVMILFSKNTLIWSKMLVAA